MMSSQRKPVVLITGAAEGIGAACASEFRRRGARLSLVDMQRAENAADDANTCWTFGDIADPSVAEQAVARTQQAFGGIDVLINNAGIGLYAGASGTPVELAQRMFDVNLFGAVRLTGLVIPAMRQRRSGAIVNIGSIGGLVSLPWCALYCSSKFALHAFSDSLRREVSKHGIHVMTVIPGIVRTGFRDHVLAGSAPQGVSAINRIISSESLARSIADGLVKGKRKIVRPRIGSLFFAIDLLCPLAMDWYCRRCWTESQSPTVRHHVASLP